MTKKKPKIQKFELLPYQLKWVLDDSPRCIFEKSRQIGLTFCEALWSVRKRLKYKIDHWFSSRDQLSGRRFIEFCNFFIDILGVPIPQSKRTLECINFPNGSKIQSLSSGKNVLRNKTGDVTLDELAFHEFPEDMFASADPVCLWGGQLRVISTHSSPGSIFNQIVQKCNAGKSQFSHHRIDVFQAVEQGLALKIAQYSNDKNLLSLLPDVDSLNKEFLDRTKKNCINSFIWDHEYRVMVHAGVTTIITPQQYNTLAMVEGVPEELERDRNYGPLYVGIDVGRTQAFTVVWVLEEKYDEINKEKDYWTVAVKSMKDVPIQQQITIISKLVDHKDVQSIVIDMGAQGRGISDSLVEQFGAVTKPIGLAPNIKRILAEIVRKYVETERVALPKDNTMILTDLTSMEYNNGKYSGRTDFSHCDFFWALGMALYAAEETCQTLLVV